MTPEAREILREIAESYEESARYWREEAERYRKSGYLGHAVTVHPDLGQADPRAYADTCRTLAAHDERLARALRDREAPA
jgi:hypothetical protein